jgi:hypothetical protein
MSEEQKPGQEGCCKTDHKCCGCKKFFVGVLAGLALAVLAHCFLCGGGSYCHKSSKMMCPISQMQAPAR